MRLYQLARKLKIQADIAVDYAESQGHTIENNPNTKLNEQQIEMLTLAFSVEEEETIPVEEITEADIELESNTSTSSETEIEIEIEQIPSESDLIPEIIAENEPDPIEKEEIQQLTTPIVESQVVEINQSEINTESTFNKNKETVSEISVAEIIEPIIPEIQKTEIQEEQTIEITEIQAEENIVEITESSNSNIVESTVLSPEELAESGVELIKAPKITLKGIKVLGKIDLPESKKKTDSKKEVSQELVNTPTESTNSETKTEEGPHPNKKTKIVNVQKEISPLAKKIETQETLTKLQLKEKKKAERKSKAEAEKKQEQKKNKIQSKKKNQQNNKIDQDNTPNKKKISPEKPKKGILGRFWDWLNDRN